MGMISHYIGLASFYSALMPSKKDWQNRIDEVSKEYFEETIKLPRKAKKRRRKELNKSYSFLVSLRDFETR